MAIFSVFAPTLLNGLANTDGEVLSEKINEHCAFLGALFNLEETEDVLKQYPEAEKYGLEIIMSEDDNQEIYLEDCDGSY